ncbi:hypothetical protein K469DRAFT_747765 [Zopfia rhizophila CBS 207.26]|uniref:Uncharacterized protein n=1 Tax=Zopfia rhizophila CBS 207.26 TaxID=1314779 RepID=A0A6A6EIP3_9PEZI|nr:hypothetical protein K469DRAFT_747765 [Zopfia rhizophila CBS 207.26]
MPDQSDDLLLSLQSSLRNTLHTFGPESPQYRSIKGMVDEHVAKLALKEKLEEGKKAGSEIQTKGMVDEHVAKLALKEKLEEGKKAGSEIQTKGMVDEHVAKLALKEKLEEGKKAGSEIQTKGMVVNLAFRPRGR